jgi:hypothetical protein
MALMWQLGVECLGVHWRQPFPSHRGVELLEASMPDETNIRQTLHGGMTWRGLIAYEFNKC